jgi:hypothetical protein
MSTPKKWENYEQVAIFLLDQFASTLGLERVEGKQVLAGRRSGTRWEIDGKGVLVGAGEAIILIECRRYTVSRQKQERLAAFAYRVFDTGAQGGILVSPLGVQAGAGKIAESEKIETVLLKEDSTTTDYFMQFLNKIFVGVSDAVRFSDDFSVTVIPGIGSTGT